MRLRTGAVLLLATVAAVACAAPAPSGSPSPTPTPRLPTPSPVPSGELQPGWSRVDDPLAGFSIGLPDSWDRAVLDSPSFDADIAAIAGRNADLARFVSDAFKNAKDRRLKLLAADPRSAAAGFATNANVMVTDLGAPAKAPGLTDLANAKLGTLRADASVIQPPVARRRTLPAGQSVQVTYAFDVGDRKVFVVTYLLVDDRGGFRRYIQLTLGTTSDDHDALFESFVASFQVTTPPPRPTPSPSTPPSASPHG